MFRELTALLAFKAIEARREERKPKLKPAMDAVRKRVIAEGRATEANVDTVIYSMALSEFRHFQGENLNVSRI
ncbi:MAG: hypothetical protein ABI680_05960, partial [Chthoniobacteraceae bacterium]